MEIPTIPLRRNPRLAIVFLVFGLAAAVVGIILSQIVITFLGVLPVLLAGLMMLNPMVLLADDHVELKNMFGLTRANYAHDGLHLVQVVDDVIYIQKGEQRAPLRRVAKVRLHAGDWAVMVDTLAAIREMRKKLR